jgi:hypothetical protein
MYRKRTIIYSSNLLDNCNEIPKCSWIGTKRQRATRIVGEGQQLAKSFLSAALAGGSAMTVLYPIGLARTKLALDVGQENRRFPSGMRDGTSLEP